MQTVTDLGELGTVDGILTPIDLTLERNGAAWDLTAYTAAQIVVVDLRTKAPVAAPGAVAIQTPATAGVVRWAPTAAAHATSGIYEGRIVLTSPAGDEPSGLFRWTIGAN